MNFTEHRETKTMKNNTIKHI